MLVLNETDIELLHQPTPPSYATADWEDPSIASQRHPGLMVSHGMFMCLTFFIFLPMGMALRAVKHRLHGLAVAAQWTCTVLGLASGSLYRKLTPDMYPGQSHSRHGYVVLLIALAITSIDAAGLLRRLFSFLRAKQFTLRAFSNAFTGHTDREASEYVGLIGEEVEMDSAEDTKNRNGSFEEAEFTPAFDHGNTEQWASHVRTHSNVSDGTLFSPASPRSEDTLHDVHFIPRLSILRRMGHVVFSVAEWSLIFGGFAMFLSGLVVYTGVCRENFVTGCLAHLIKGGIFWSYGLLTFARFLGFCAELGWSWNRAPSSGYPTAEFVESFVIFLYGVTNTWMERFGASPGDPFTTKQIQHIGIAVMFWFAGLIGMAVESKTIRRWLAALAVDTSESVAEPVTYTSSFNPFPALVIGVTGSVMAAHFQEYLFQVQIHALWGNLLLAFAVMRCVTYFFLWVSPPSSTLPSRPPTEALASFFLAAGGISFIFSTEEITFAAMRRGHDDIMLFVVMAVSSTCIAFCWTVIIISFQGWLKTRTKPTAAYHRSA
ncbi:hypothetical protein FB45DRAFT_408557 [Roridomyces roridus]|uniref:Integral membrane protein n=1 Tax=Roridomyces roridus TaxID=1738132 RepID=A0AAD7C4N0_9AGAR|nr:hypothetical protein FB45DRAFT_408557 [Roridomyces roridus]